MVPIVGLSALAVDYGSAATSSLSVHQWAQEACNRINSAYLAAQPTADRVAAADALMAHRLANASADLSSTVSYSVVDSGGAVFVMASGSLSSVAGSGAMNIDINLPCDPEAGGPGIIFTEGFENPVVSPGWSWEVFSGLPNWTATGFGPQLNRDGVHWAMPAPNSGMQHLELDSDPTQGAYALPTGLGTMTSADLAMLNSSITRTVYLTPGTYELSFFSKRPSLVPVPGDFIVRAYVEAEATAPFSTTFVAEGGGTFAWASTTAVFSVPAAGNYRITFREEGIPNRVGALLDDVALARM